MMTLLDLPDELWISILHDWISNSIVVLTALDIAFCNQLLRPAYLRWVTFLSKKITFAKGYKRSSDGKCISDMFLRWCEKRQLRPTYLSYSYFIDHNKQQQIPEEAPAVDYIEMAQKELLIGIEYFQLFYYFPHLPTYKSVSVISNVLNDFPKLKQLEVSKALNSSVRNMEGNKFFQFTFHLDSYPLLTDLQLAFFGFSFFGESLFSIFGKPLS